MRKTWEKLENLIRNNSKQSSSNFGGNIKISQLSTSWSFVVRGVVKHHLRKVFRKIRSAKEILPQLIASTFQLGKLEKRDIVVLAFIEAVRDDTVLERVWDELATMGLPGVDRQRQNTGNDGAQMVPA